MAITLAEEIMLLSLDDESGSAKQRQAAGWAVSGGILLELVLAGRVSVAGKYLELTDTTPTGDQLLDSRTALIEIWLRGRSKRRVTEWLTKEQPKAVAAALESLCKRGVVVEEKHKAFGVFPIRRYPRPTARSRANCVTGSGPSCLTAPSLTHGQRASSR